MFLRINSWEVNSIHKMVQGGFPVGEVLACELTILDFRIEVLSIGGSLSDLAESLPVENLANEIQSLLEVIVESFEDNVVKVLKAELSLWTLTGCLTLYLVQRAHLFSKDACLVLLESLVLFLLFPELCLQCDNLLVLAS